MKNEATISINRFHIIGFVSSVLVLALFISSMAFASQYGRGAYDSGVYSTSSSSSGGSSSSTKKTKSSPAQSSSSSTTQTDPANSTDTTSSDSDNGDYDDSSYYDNGENAPKKSTQSSWIWWLVGILSFTIVGFIIFFIYKRRKNRDQNFTPTNFN